MNPTPLVPVVDGVFRWSVWNEPRKLWFNGHLLQVGEVLIAVDPVELSDEVLAAVEALGKPALCVITNKDHERAGLQLRERFGSKVLVPAADAEVMVLVGEGISHGSEVVPGLQVIGVADGKSPGELALHWEARRLLVLGDAAVGRPAGALSMLPADKFGDVVAAKAGVAALARLEVEVILVGDGEDILTGGAAALRALGEGPAKAPPPVFGAKGC